MSASPPGTLLQLMYLEERLSNVQPGFFIEIGPGTGEITSLLLRLGWTGKAYDLADNTIKRLSERFSNEISDGKLELSRGDFCSIEDERTKAHLVISCMVLEHLPNNLERKFMEKAATVLCEDGIMIGLVPASDLHWGIEDEIAGHQRRYSRQMLLSLAQQTGWRINHISGLTYPISNILLPISNFLVKRAEHSKLTLSDLEKTKCSGNRAVLFKTYFPDILIFILNRFTMIPFNILQKVFRNSSNCLVLYFEASCTR